MSSTLCRAVLFGGVLLWILTDPTHCAILTLLAVCIHEMGHVIAAKLAGVQLKGFFVDSLGARLTLGDAGLSYQKEILICSAGPVANVLSVLLIKCTGAAGSNASFFLSVSLALALLNLLPIRGFDGGRTFYCLGALLTTPTLAEQVSSLLSFFSLFFLWCISIYLMLKTGADISLFLFSVSVFSRIFLQHKMP